MLLTPPDGPPFEAIRGDTERATIFLCEHASAAIPRKLGTMGLGPEDLRRHIAFDIGVDSLARSLCARLGASAILGRFSRLVYDVNRCRDDPEAIPEVSDGTSIPGNLYLSERDRRDRRKSLFDPFQNAVAEEINRIRLTGRHPLIMGLHSFTRGLRGQPQRPWKVGVVYKDDRFGIARDALEWLRNRLPAHEVGDNEPYSRRAKRTSTIEDLAEDAGLPNLLLEVRQDLIETEQGIAQYAALIQELIEFLRARKSWVS